MNPKFLYALFLASLVILSCTNNAEKSTSKDQDTQLKETKNYLITSSGDSIITGIPFLAVGKKVNPDSISKPQSIALKKPPKKIPIQTNSKPASKPKVVIIPENLTVITPGKNGVPLPVVRPAIGKTVTALQPPPVRASNPQMKESAVADIRYLDIEQGMNSKLVWSMLYDSRGVFWFGTLGGGVSRYDGTYFTHFTENEGLSNNNLYSIFEDSKGHLWFGTRGGGVNRYDGNQFVHFTTKDGLANNIIMVITEDKQGHIWIGTSGGGVSRYDG